MKHLVYGARDGNMTFLMAVMAGLSLAASAFGFEPAGLVSADIGAPAIAGSVVVTNNTVDMIAGGLDIGGTSDQCHYWYEQKSGDFDVAVRIQSLENSDVWAKAGLMVREGLEANSRAVSVLATPTLSGCLFAVRATVSGNASAWGSFRVNFPETWLRLQHTGDVFNGYASLDGHAWTLLGTTNLVLPEPFYFGLAAASHSSNQVAVAQFRDWRDVDSSDTIEPANVEALGPSTRKTGLAITEIMYHPAPRTDGLNLEFIELFNSNPIFEDISGYRLAGDLDYTFPDHTVMPGGSFLVVAKSPGDLAGVYGFSAGVLGPFTNGLKSVGTIQLLDKTGAIFLEVPYANQPPWPVAADGTGHSLVLLQPSHGEANPMAWSASGQKGGSPGAVDTIRPSALRQVVINEFLAQTDPATEAFVELYNHSNKAADISGCFLSDDPGTNKFKIPNGSMIPARGFACFTRTQMGFALDAGGGTIYFTNPDQTQVWEALRFEAQRADVSMARHPDGAAEFYPMTRPTPGASNSDILVSDIVINEIMYRPLSGDDNDEYIELFNRGGQAMDIGGWRFTAGFDFTFPANTRVAAGGFVVVARNAERLRAQYPELDPGVVVGNYQGKLANGGERVALAAPATAVRAGQNNQSITNPIYAVVDEVAYGTGGRWPHWADGGGSSLELVDPRGNHRRASNWADSDETGKSAWTTVESTGVLDNGMGTMDSLHVLLLGEGECLLDNVEVYAEGSPTNLIANSTFETGMTGWVAQGDHARTTLDPAGGYQGGNCLRIRASKQGDTGANRIRVPLKSNSALREGQTATIRAKVRWLRGFPEIVLRLKGNYLEAFGRLSLPANLGTPGAPNSQGRANAGPAIYEVVHNPPLPAANQPAVVTARADDPDGLASLVLKYRIDPGTNYTAVDLVDDGTGSDAIAGDGLFSAAIPGQPAGKLAAFYVEAVDQAAGAETTRFPSEAPRRECLVRFGEIVPASSFGTYRMWLTSATVDTWKKQLILSNEELDGTFVYGNQRVIYSIGARYSGSPFHQSGFTSPVGALCTYALSMPADDQLLGTTSFNKLHAPGNGAGDDGTIQREQTAYWMVRQLGLPWNYMRYVNVYVNGLRRGTLMEDTQVPGTDVLDEHFPTDPDGDLFKLNYWFEYDYAASGAMNFNFQSTYWCSLNNFTTTGGAKKLARYRYNWAPRADHGTVNNYTNVFALIDAADTPLNGPFGENMEAQADIRQWLRTFAIEHAVGNWDSFGNRNAQNMYAYKPKRDKWKLLIWDFNIVLGNSGSDGPAGDNLFQYNTSDRNMAKMYSYVPFVREYLRNLQEIATGPMADPALTALMDARYAAFKANGVSVGSPAPIKTYINSRRNYLTNFLNSLEVPFQIENHQGQPVSVDQNWILLAGTAPVGVQSIQVNGLAYPVTWADALHWNVRVPLSAQTNSIQVRGLDADGNPLAGAVANITVTFTGMIESAADHLVINEIMYHPASPDAEFVEIHNTSAVSVFDLSNYRLGGVDFTFSPGALIEPDGYVAVAKNRAAFAAAYGNAIKNAGEFAGRLDNGGETIKLIKPGAIPTAEVVIDQVTFNNNPPWPRAADGSGASLQLVDPRRDNDRVGNWAAISAEAAAQPGWKFASVTGIANSSRLLLHHSPFQPLPDLTSIAGRWDGIIRFTGLDYQMTIEFRRTATGQWEGDFNGQDTAGPLANIRSTNSTVSFDLANTGSAVVRWSGRLSTNGNVITGTFSQTGSPSSTFTLNRYVDPTVILGGDMYLDDLSLVAGDVAEAGPNLVRNGDFEQALAGTWNVASNHAASAVSTAIKHSGNASLRLVANRGGRDEDTAVWQDSEPLTPGRTYTLSYWYLPSTNGVDLTVRLAGQSLVSQHSIQPDKMATPGSPNSTRATLPEFAPLYLNEIEPENVHGLADHLGHHAPWVELVNRGSTAVALTGYYLSSASTNLLQWAFPADAVIQPGQYLLVWLDAAENESVANEWHANFRSAPENGSVILTRHDLTRETVLDYLNYRGVAPDYSYGVNADTRSRTRQVFQNPTPGAANDNPATPAKVSINEWMAANSKTLADPADRKFSDWFELFNPGPQPVDLSGYSLSDDPTNTAKCRIPAGTKIAANGFLLVWADQDTQQNGQNANLHVNFKLSQTGEFIGLYAPDGALVDCVNFGAQTVDASQGRWPDGQEGTFYSMTTPTPGKPNVVAPIGPNPLRITGLHRLTGGTVTLTWESEAGLNYQVQCKNSLTDPAWTDLGPPLRAEGGSASLSDEISGLPGLRIYRVLLVK